MNEFVFRTRGSLLLSELLASSRIRHGGSPLSGSPWKCILLSEVECHVNKQLTSRARSSRIGEYWPLVVTATTKGQYSPVRSSRSVRSLRAGGILQILQSYWFRERAVFYDLARQPGRNRQGHPTTIFGRYLFGRLFEIENFRNIFSKISCLSASPRIFEHLKNGIIAHF